jgi:hypothetical protein
MATIINPTMAAYIKDLLRLFISNTHIEMWLNDKVIIDSNTNRNKFP